MFIFNQNLHISSQRIYLRRESERGRIREEKKSLFHECSRFEELMVSSRLNVFIFITFSDNDLSTSGLSRKHLDLSSTQLNIDNILLWICKYNRCLPYAFACKLVVYCTYKLKYYYARFEIL